MIHRLVFVVSGVLFVWFDYFVTCVVLFVCGF